MISWLNSRVAQPLIAFKSRSGHLRVLKQLEKSQFDSPTEIASRQLIALKAIVKHSCNTVPYYRDRWQSAGLHPDAIQSLDDLKLFPLLTKNDLRDHQPQLISQSADLSRATLKTTSGSTGIAVKVYVDDVAMSFKRACTIRSDQWSGYQLGNRVARLWGFSKVERGNWKSRMRRHFVDREQFLNTLNVDESQMKAFAMALSRKQPGLLFGHAHSLYLFATYCRKHFPGMVRPSGVISAAMMLHDWQRAVIEEAFGKKVCNRYGCEEVSLIAAECDHHQGLHVNSDSVYVEIIPDSRFATEQGGGSIVVTDLRNIAMPIIRYKVGDVAVQSTKLCTCGRGLPLLEKIAGREADYVLTPSGKLISGISLTDHFATEIRGAAQVQIVQEQLRFLRLRMVADDRFGPNSRRQVDHLVHEMFGPEMNYEIDLVDAIPQEPSGKYRFCVSPVANEYLKSMAL